MTKAQRRGRDAGCCFFTAVALAITSTGMDQRQIGHKLVLGGGVALASVGFALWYREMRAKVGE